MCRNIRPLHNYSPPTEPADVDAAALQFVRKVSGMQRPSRANAEAFDRAVAAVAAATAQLLDELVATTPPKDRAAEIVKARQRRVLDEARARLRAQQAS